MRIPSSCQRLLICFLILLSAPVVSPASAEDDTTPPVITVTANGSPLAEGSVYAGQVTPEITADDDESSVTVEATLNGLPYESGTTITEGGQHVLSITATDAASNAVSLLRTFWIEEYPPLFERLSPAEGTVTSAAEVTLWGRVNGAAELTVDGATVALLGSGDFTAGPYALAEGERTFTLVATSPGGQTTQLVHHVTRDATPPSISLTSPAEDAVLSTRLVTVTGTASDAHLSSVEVNGRAASVDGTTFTAVVGLPDGRWTLSARAADAAGNAGEASRQVTVDTRAPVVAVTDPAPGTVVPEATLTISGTARDPHLDRVEVAGATATLTGERFSIEVTLAEGVNTFVATAYDTLGHQGTAGVEVTRESAAPSVRIDSPAEGLVTSASTVDVSGTVTAGATVTVNGEAATMTGGAFSAAGIELFEGENRLIARATDADGDEGVYTRMVTRDSAGPSWVGSDPLDGAAGIAPGTVLAVGFDELLAAPAAGSWRLETAAGTSIAASASLTEGVLEVRPDAALPASSEVRLVLTAALTDLAGNPLVNPGTLSFTTTDGAAAGPPVIDAVPPRYLCAFSWTLTGTATANALVRVEGGAGAAEARAEADGSFVVPVSLLPGRLHRLSVTSTVAGVVSPATVVEVVQDCAPPAVTSAERAGDVFTVSFSEPVQPSTVDGAITLSDASGAVAGTVVVTTAETATWTASSALPSGTYLLQVSQTVIDLAGNALAFPYSRVFSDAAEESFFSGTVIDEVTGRPLSGARVVVTATGGEATAEPRPEQTTGADGRFLIAVPAGTHGVTVARPGYTPVFRIVTTVEGLGTEVFDPRLTPASEARAVTAAAGGTVSVEGAALDVPAQALAADASVTLTAVGEQGLAALLPYGWTPRGAVWLDVEEELTSPATLSFAVESPNGATLTVAKLDVATLQWRSVDDVLVVVGEVTVTVSTFGAYAAVEPDTGALEPPPAVVGEVLGSSPAPEGGEVTAAAVSFEPAIVTPDQTADATAVYTLASEAASGLPLTLVIREELELLDGTIRRFAPFRADVVVYRALDGTPRSRFRLRPSMAARRTLIRGGALELRVVPYGDESVRGNVLGPEGGTVVGDAGDRLAVGAGALTAPTAVTLTRRTVAELPLAAPAGGTVDGVVEVDLGGAELAVPGSLTLSMDTPPPAGEVGLLLQVVDIGAAPRYRAVAELAPSASGWTTKSIVPADLPWPGVTTGGHYVFLHLTAPHAFVRGTAYRVDGTPLAGGIVESAGVDWIQITGSDGRYVLPVPVGEATIEITNPATGNAVSSTVTASAGDERVDLDPRVLAIGPEVISTSPTAGAAVPAGTTPQVTFSEAINPGSVPDGIALFRAGEELPVDFEIQGALVTVLPRSTLIAGTYELRVGTGIRDLQGYVLVHPVTVTFTVDEVVLPSEIDVTRIRLIEPDSADMAQVVGDPGAVPSGYLVWVENLDAYVTTTSVAAGQDGSFELAIGASVEDRLLFHVLIPGANEVVVLLGPYMGEDLKSAWVGPQGASFSTVDGFTLIAAEDTFTRFTKVRLDPRPTEPPAAPRPPELEAMLTFDLDFGGAEAKKPLQIRVQVPAETEEIVYLLNRQVMTYAGPAWMMYDLMWLDGDELTTEDADQAPPPPASTLAEPAAKGVINTPPPRPPFSYKKYLPEAVFPGTYEVVTPVEGLVFMATPFPPAAQQTIWNVTMEGIVANINRAVGQFLEHDAVLIPSILNRQYEVEVRELATGFLVSSGVYDPPATGDDLVLLPPDNFGDTQPPLPIAGGPVRFFRFFPNERLSGDLDEGIRWSYDATLGELRVEGDPASAHPQVEVVLLDFDGGQTQTGATGADGSFSLQAAAPLGHRWVLAVGAVVTPDEVPEITFSEGLDLTFAGLQILSQAGTEVRLFPQPVGNTDTVRLVPLTHWHAGRSYTIRLGPEVADAAGNAWQRTLEVGFEVAGGEVLDTYDLTAVRDVARLGSWLFVAADFDGLMVIDAADPSDLQNVVPSGVGFPFTGADPVTGVDVDPHGLVYVVGGGVTNFGQLKIFDPLLLDPQAVATAAAQQPPDLDGWFAAFRGSTLISDKIGGTGTQLPQGTPKRVSVLSNNQVDRWNVGQVPPDAALALNPPPELWSLTVGGRAPQGQEVELENLDSGDRQTVLADAAGELQFTLSVHTGDQLRLTRPGDLVTVWRAGQRLSGDLWVSPWNEPQGYTLQVSGEAEPRHPVTLKDLTRGRWYRVDADAQGHFEVTLEVFPGDELELLRNVDTFAYVATSGVGIQVVDAGRLYSSSDSIQSHVIGIYSGAGDPALNLCGFPVSDISTALLDVGSLLDTDNDFPFTVAGLVAFKGFALINSDVNNPGELSFINHGCAEVDGDGAVSGFEVVQDYPFDFDGDGAFSAQEVGDYVIVAHHTAGVLVYAITDRTGVVPLGQVKVPGNAAAVHLDRVGRRLYVSGYTDGVYVIDFDLPPFFDVLDDDGDGVDDRVIETILLGGNTNAGLLLVPELGLGFAGGLGRGLTSMAVGEPKLVAVRNSVDGPRRAISRLAPFGVPAAPENRFDPESFEQTGSFHVLAQLPGFTGDQVTVEVLGLGPSGQEIAAAGDPTRVPNLPPTSLRGTDAVVLERLAVNPWEEGYHLFESKEIVALADLRAAQHFERSDRDEEQCPRCDQPDYMRGQALEVLSGDSAAVRFTPESLTLLEPIYGVQRLEEAELELASVRWDVAPSTRQEPTLNPSQGSGEVAPGTLLHSGETSASAVDLFVRGRGLDFTFQRSYRSQTIGSGPLGPGWDHAYRQRLRKRPDGDVEWYDGGGRREVFKRAADGSLEPPAGRFVDLVETTTGWIMVDARRNTVRFDVYGRLASIADPFKTSESAGNEIVFHYDQASRLESVVDSLDRVMTFEYDAQGRLIKVADFDDREVEYAYDADGRLVEVRSPRVTGAMAPSFTGDRLITSYGYEADLTGDLAQKLAHRDNLTTLSDPRGTTWLELTYDDEDGDGRRDELSSQEWGGFSINLTYYFDQRRTQVLDRRANQWTYEHDEEGHMVRAVDPLGGESSAVYGEGGIIEELTRPLGSKSVFEYLEGPDVPPRSRGLVVAHRLIPDTRGTNSTAPGACTPVEEDECVQGIRCVCAYEVVSDTAYDLRTNLPLTLSDRRGNETSFERDETGLASSVSLPIGAEVQFEYNEYGQPTREESPIGTVKTYTYYEDGPSRGYLKDETIGGLTTSYEYDARGNVTAVVDRRGVRTETVWNELDWMVQVTQAASGSNDGAPALGYANRFFYDAVGNVVEEQSPYGETGSQTTSTHTTYGVLSEVLTVAKETEPGGPVLTASNVYDSNFNVVQSIDGNGHVDTFTYDERNLRTQASFGDGLASEQYGYDLEHNMTSRVDGRGNVRIYRYDGKSRLKETEDPLGNRTVTRYDDSDNATVIESWDAEGVLLSRVVNVYDEVSRLVEVRTSLFDDLGGETLVISRSEYDAASNLTKTIDPEGRETLFEYDDAERLARVIDPAGNVTQHQLDGNSNATLTTVVEKLPDGTTEPVSKTFAYDALNRLLNATDALGNVSRTEYDARSNVIRQIDQEGNVTSATYDALGRRLTATQPEGIALNYAYDGNSNLVTQADALGNATLYTYDALDRSTAVRYADLTQWTTVYDGNGNATRVTDANGTVIDQTFDAANRLTSRAATPAPGVEGSTVETFLYDGLSRQVRSQSGDVVVTSEYDSLSRLTAETVAGRRMEYFYNLAGAATGATYPSGLQVAIDLDVLDRPLAIHGDAQEAVGYEYRGPSLLHGKTLGNGLASTLSYDAARRLTEHLSVNQSGDAVLTETLAWSPRWLKVSHVRGDVAGADRVIHHDGAGRVTEVGTADLGVANNTTPSSAAVAAAADGFSYQYDAAQNLLTRTRRTAGTEEQVDLPSDGSGRNRPASVDGVLLEWDANGNLISKGDLGLHYDFRNRLVRVEREGVGDLAHYEYDAQNRRVKRTAGGVDTEIAWAGWQEMEEYVGGQLAKRRVFGTGLDEIVRLELDADGNGTLETELTPLYDSNGSLVAVTDTAGKPVERYDYSPYGEQLILVDSTAPQVTQVRIAGGELWVEVSEDVLPSALADAVTAGQVTLVDDATLEALPISLSQPVLTGRMARRRLVITTTDPPAAGTAVTLRFEPAALRDPFLNALAAAFELPFTWSTTDTVVHDGGAPSWQLVTVEDDHMLITFSEEVDPASVASAVTVDGGPLTWTPEPDRYALRSSTALAAGTHSLEILTTVADLDGQTLASGLTAAFEIAAAGSSFLVDQVADPRHVVSTATGNLHGFHGRPLDPETGLLYFRNRYYDPELGRFLSVDPMGFVDGPSPYAFAGYSPFDNSDPMGLCIDGFGDKTEFCQGLRRGLSEAVDRFIREEGDYTTRQSMQFLKGAVVGLQRLPKNVVEGGISLFKIAMGAAKAAGEAVVNPEEGIEKISEAVSSFSFDEVKSQTLSSLDQYLNNLANASPEKQGEIFGEDVISEVVAGGAATAAAKLTKATKVRRLAGAPRFGPRRSGQRIGESLESIMPGHRPGRIGGIVVDKYTSGAGDYVPGEDFIRLSRRGVKANTRLEVQQMSPDATWRDTLYFTVYHESFHKGIYPVDRFINRIIGKDPYWEFTRYRLAQEYTASVYGQLRASIRAAKGWRQTIKDIDTRRRYWRDFERASYLADR